MTIRHSSQELRRGVAFVNSTPELEVKETPSGSAPMLKSPVWLKSHVAIRHEARRYRVQALRADAHRDGEPPFDPLRRSVGAGDYGHAQPALA